MAQAPLATGKQKIVCLHGYMQNGEILRRKMGSWKKGLRANYELVFVDAPIIVSESDNPEIAQRLEESSLEHRSWWHFTSPQPGQRPGTRHPVKITGWDDAKATIRGALQQHGPVFGLMGFSQGATAAAMYASCCAADAALPAPRCVVCVAGFMPRDDECAAWLRRDGVAMPALHVVGEADEIISRERSEELAKVCAAGRTHVHAGGHLVPSCTGEVKQCLTQFFDGVPAEGGGVGRASQAVSAL